MDFHISSDLMFSIMFVSLMHFHNHLCISISTQILKEMLAKKPIKPRSKALSFIDGWYPDKNYFIWIFVTFNLKHINEKLTWQRNFIWLCWGCSSGKFVLQELRGYKQPRLGATPTWQNQIKKRYNMNLAENFFSWPRSEGEFKVVKVWLTLSYRQSFTV